MSSFAVGISARFLIHFNFDARRISFVLCGMMTRKILACEHWGGFFACNFRIFDWKNGKL